MSFDNRSSAMDGASGAANPDIQSSPVTLCKAGCGFYANQAFEGMCSKCYKDTVVLQQPPTSPSSSFSSSSSPAATSRFTTQTSGNQSSSSSDAAPDNSPSEAAAVTSIETGVPTIPLTKLDKDKNSNIESDLKEGTSLAEEAISAKEKPKRNRCLTCKKRVGLTGFECRCGGLYCSAHRYSDTHGCEFNYKELGQDQIRKNNPVVVGEKVQKF